MALFGRQTEQDEKRAEAYAQWLGQRNPCAIASAVLGIFSLIEMGVLLVFGIAGTILGIVALVQLRRTSEAISAPTSSSGEPRTTPTSAGIGYADQTFPPPIHAKDYDRADLSLPRTRGHRLAWFGIITSVLSLVVAGVLYALPLMGRR